METATATIQPGQTLTARSACDHDCIFSITVLARAGMWATIKDIHGKTRRTKVRANDNGEYLQPDRYSMAPIFRARQQPQLPHSEPTMPTVTATLPLCRYGVTACLYDWKTGEELTAAELNLTDDEYRAAVLASLAAPRGGMVHTAKGREVFASYPA